MVRGDFVFLEAGEAVAADIRMLEADYMVVDKIDMTGETSEEVRVDEIDD